MLSRSIVSTKIWRFTIAIAVLLLVAGAVIASTFFTPFVARSLFGSPVVLERSVPMSKSVSSEPLPITQNRIADFESEIITVTPHGFEPRALTRPAGRFLLLIDNRSGLPEFSPALSLLGGIQVRTMQIPREQPNWSDIVDLPPGTYVLTEANHSRWLCRITITAL